MEDVRRGPQHVTGEATFGEMPPRAAALALRVLTMRGQWLVSRQLRAGLCQLQRCAIVSKKATKCHGSRGAVSVTIPTYVDIAVQTEDLSTPEGSESAGSNSGAEPTSSSQGSSTQWAQTDSSSQSSGTSRSTRPSRHADFTPSKPQHLTSLSTSSNLPDHSSETEHMQLPETTDVAISAACHFEETSCSAHDKAQGSKKEVIKTTRGGSKYKQLSAKRQEIRNKHDLAIADFLGTSATSSSTPAQAIELGACSSPFCNTRPL